MCVFVVFLCVYILTWMYSHPCVEVRGYHMSFWIVLHFINEVGLFPEFAGRAVSASHFPPGIPPCLYFTQAGLQVGRFTCSALMWFLGSQTPVVMLMWQVLYPLSHLSSPRLFFNWKPVSAPFLAGVYQMLGKHWLFKHVRIAAEWENLFVWYLQSSKADLNWGWFDPRIHALVYYLIMAGNINKLFPCDLIIPTKIYLLLLVCFPPEVPDLLTRWSRAHAGFGSWSWDLFSLTLIRACLSEIAFPSASHCNVSWKCHFQTNHDAMMHLLEGRIHGFSGWNRMEPWESPINTTIAYPPRGNEW